jgi:hypothetical protein
MTTQVLVTEAGGLIGNHLVTYAGNTSKLHGEMGPDIHNTRIREVWGWEPQLSLKERLAPTCRWIESEIKTAGRVYVSA